MSCRQRSVSRLASLVTVVSLVILVVACNEQVSPPPTSPAPTIAPLARDASQQTETVPTLFFPPGFVPADARGVELPELSLKEYEEPPIPVFGGDARMTGTVLGPDGPVEGAVVRLERFVGSRGGYADVTTIEGGRWEAKEIFGGHYRVRAWKRKNLATVEPQVGFVKDEKDSTVELSIGVEKHEAKRLQVALDTGDPKLDQVHTLLVLHDQEEVDDDGRVRGEPIRDTEIEVSVGDNYELVGEPRALTGADGFARFSIRCKAPGKHDVTASGDGLTATVTLPECLPPADAGIDDPSVTAAPGDSTTTSVALFPIGGTFTTPYAGELPVGTYIAVTTGRSCSTEYDLYSFDGWRRSRTDGSRIDLPFPARNLRPREGTLPCTFGRIR